MANEEEVASRLATVEQRAKSNSHRIDRLEQTMDALNRLATSVEVIATKQDNMAGTLKRLDEKVDDMEALPGKRWNAVIEKVIMIVVAALVGYALSRIGLQ